MVIDHVLWVAMATGRQISFSLFINYYYRGRKLDKERFTTIHIHKTYNIPNQGHDKSSIARNIQSSKRKGKLAFIIIFDFKVLIYKNLFHILLANAQKKETPVKRTQ